MYTYIVKQHFEEASRRLDLGIKTVILKVSGQGDIVVINNYNILLAASLIRPHTWKALPNTHLNLRIPPTL